jgi:hypothetical protein
MLIVQFKRKGTKSTEEYESNLHIARIRMEGQSKGHEGDKSNGFKAKGVQDKGTKQSV